MYNKANVLTVVIYIVSILAFIVLNIGFHLGFASVIVVLLGVSIRGIISITTTELRKGVVFFAVVEGMAFCVLARIFPLVFM